MKSTIQERRNGIQNAVIKTIQLIVAAVFWSLPGTAQVTQDSVNKLQQEINILQDGINRKQSEVNAMQDAVNRNSRTNDASEELIRNILNDLMEMKIIDNKEMVAFSLSPDKMEVNHKKQPDAVLQKFKSKYHIVKGYSIAYAKNKNATSTSITK